MPYVSSSNATRWGALGALLAGVAWVATFVVVIFDYANKGLIPVFGFPYSDLGRTIYIVVLISILWGLVGLHSCQGKLYGRLGSIGFLTAYVGGTLALVGLGLTWLFRGNVLGQEPAITLGLSGMVVGLMLLGGGFLLLGVAVLRAGTLPVWCGLALIIAFIAVIVSLVFPASLGSYVVTVVLGVVWLGLGAVLWKEQSEARAEGEEFAKYRPADRSSSNEKDPNRVSSSSARDAGK